MKVSQAVYTMLLEWDVNIVDLENIKKTLVIVSEFGWGDEDARVVCRQLWFQAEGELLSAVFFTGAVSNSADSDLQ